MNYFATVLEKIKGDANHDLRWSLITNRNFSGTENFPAGILGAHLHLARPRSIQ
jgi:hypothetical protein